MGGDDTEQDRLSLEVLLLAPLINDDICVLTDAVGKFLYS